MFLCSLKVTFYIYVERPYDGGQKAALIGQIF
jgi:hypothetical protein